MINLQHFGKKHFLHRLQWQESCYFQAAAKLKEADQITLNIGYQKYGILPIVKERAVLEQALKNQNVKINWVEFPAGPQLLEGLNVGSVSFFGEAGEAPPIFCSSCASQLGVRCQSTCSAIGRSVDCAEKFSPQINLRLKG